jgi:glycosyltransferase involved in cell wall biosynthesis
MLLTKEKLTANKFTIKLYGKLITFTHVEESGFLAATNEEWLEKLSLLASDEELRRTIGKKGRETVKKHYSLKLWGPKLAAFYKGQL